MKAAGLMVKCLEAEGVNVIFGLPGEENIDFIDELRDSSIRFILTRHEQGASFMADIYGRITGRPGVCLATLGPGAINLTLGTADAQLDSSPLVAIAGQASSNRLFKEFHQVIDLVELFGPITKWGSLIMLPDSVPEIVRKAFKVAVADRPGATLIVLPEDIARHETNLQPLPVAYSKPESPEAHQVKQAQELLKQSKQPVILAGHGVCRSNASETLKHFAEKLHIPVATTFMAKGVIPADNHFAIGTIGFMRHDYVNFGFDQADLVITVGYDLVEYSPEHWNPHMDKNVIHIHTMPAEVDRAYAVQVEVLGDISQSLEHISSELPEKKYTPHITCTTRNLLDKELKKYAEDDSFPLKPQRIVSDLRKALAPEDIMLCDTGALKMWISRLFPCYKPNTCLVSNGLGTMGFSVPGALAAKLVCPERNVIAVTGDGSFMMNSQELETAKRENLPFVVLIWKDSHYGLIKWKQELEFGRSAHVSFKNPDYVVYAESFGIKGYRIKHASDLLPTLREAFAAGELAVIECEVDYSENTRLTDMLSQIQNISPSV
jgi:acetolactate synthase-1/2/3 large subunit